MIFKILKSKKSKNKIEKIFFNSLPIELIRKPYQSSIRINIKMNGRIHLSASKTISSEEIFEFLKRSQTWIEKKMKKTVHLKKKYPLKRYIQDEDFLFLGEKYKLKFYPSLISKEKVKIETHLKEIKVLIPKVSWNSKYFSHSKLEIKKNLLKVYRDYGKNILSQSLKFYAYSMGLKFSKISFRCQKTRWGSCSPDGHISLNWRLIVAPINVLNYVVVHELAHLKYMDHSKKFWNFVKKFCPNYEKEKSWLNENQFEMDFLAPQSEIH